MRHFCIQPRCWTHVHREAYTSMPTKVLPSLLEARDVSLSSPEQIWAPEFTYRPLNQDPPEIRLLELKPAAERALSLECTLRHSALSSARYSCLSYVWGDPNKDAKSEIGIAYKKTIGEHFKPKRRRGSESNRCRMKIGSSLAAALRHLRHSAIESPYGSMRCASIKRTPKRRTGRFRS